MNTDEARERARVLRDAANDTYSADLIDALLAEVDRLRELVESCERHIAESRVRQAKMINALEPFAAIGEAYNRPPQHPLLALSDDDQARPGPDGLTVGDFRRAAQALKDANAT